MLVQAVAVVGAVEQSLVELEEAVAADPAYAGAVAAWSECMAAAGFDFNDPDEARRSAQAGFEQAIERAQEEDRPLEGHELAELSEAERTLAVADFTCRGRTIDPVVARIADGKSAFGEAERLLAALLERPQ